VLWFVRPHEVDRLAHNCASCKDIIIMEYVMASESSLSTRSLCIAIADMYFSRRYSTIDRWSMWEVISLRIIHDNFGTRFSQKIRQGVREIFYSDKLYLLFVLHQPLLCDVPSWPQQGHTHGNVGYLIFCWSLTDYLFCYGSSIFWT
jgi:hypothetical protein